MMPQTGRASNRQRRLCPPGTLPDHPASRAAKAAIPAEPQCHETRAGESAGAQPVPAAPLSSPIWTGTVGVAGQFGPCRSGDRDGPEPQGGPAGDLAVLAIARRVVRTQVDHAMPAAPSANPAGMATLPRLIGQYSPPEGSATAWSFAPRNRSRVVARSAGARSRA
jgi:hypothetical protein